ncbi:MAG: SUMF1/EgtB/PvdO family nonheme iron enzyme [Deltaproteobacteria bacterium]|nr:SUMF1/EgtB/PvdO family nonheme iron enzyme [Deltaproteobacteria bacterium]
MTASSHEDYKRGDVIAKKYEIERLLGEGMLGATYLAKHIASGKDLVLKILRRNLVATERDRDRLCQLFERARAVRHELLIRYGELAVHEYDVYFTEEYYPSENLRQVIQGYVAEKKAFTLQEACQIVIPILEAAEAGHQAGIIHQDLKPENVLLQTRKTGPQANAKIVRSTKVTGLGLVGIVSPTIFAESFLNRANAPYLAPELVGFDQAAGPQADVYSVGVMLYELLCGQRPMGTYLAPTQLRSDLPEHLDLIVETALAHNPEDRYPTPRDMIRDLQRSFLVEMQQGRTRISFRNLLIGIGIGGLVVAAVGSWFFASGGADDAAEAQRQDDLLRQQVRIQNPAPSEAEIKEHLAKNPGMVYVPGGTFVRGRLHAERSEVAGAAEPLAEVVRVAPFYIDRLEFPNTQGSKPAVRVSWERAADACVEVGKRLCTDVEWEKACKGPANLIYSYGDTFDPAKCGADVVDPYVLGGRPECVSGYGAYDLSGGVREWTATNLEGKSNRHLVKGGMRGNPQRGYRCASSMDEGTAYSDAILGFRCCLDAQAPPRPPKAPVEGETQGAKNPG